MGLRRPVIFVPFHPSRRLFSCPQVHRIGDRRRPAFFGLRFLPSCLIPLQALSSWRFSIGKRRPCRRRCLPTSVPIKETREDPRERGPMISPRWRDFLFRDRALRFFFLPFPATIWFLPSPPSTRQGGQILAVFLRRWVQQARNLFAALLAPRVMDLLFACVQKRPVFSFPRRGASSTVAFYLAFVPGVLGFLIGEPHFPNSLPLG